jgi:hypothetical protein
MGQGQSQLQGEPWKFVERCAQGNCRGDGHVPAFPGFSENVPGMLPMAGDVRHDSAALTRSDAAIPLP